MHVNLTLPILVLELQSKNITGVHSASAPGVACVAVHPSDSNTIITGGEDKMAYVFDTADEKVVSTLKVGRSDELSPPSK